MNKLRNRIDWALTTDFDGTDPPTPSTVKAMCWIIAIILILGVLTHA